MDLPESHWNRTSIREERKKKLEVLSLSREQLIERVLELETALYPFVYVLGSLNDKSWRGTMANSKLFPFKSEDDCFQVYKEGKTEDYKKLSESDLHDIDYFEEDSIIIEDGSQLNDLFSILEVNQQAPGASVGCGSIVMGDVRYAKQIFHSSVCTCLSSSEDDAYDPGGPMSGKPRPPHCTVHPGQDGRLTSQQPKKPSGPIKD